MDHSRLPRPHHRAIRIVAVWCILTLVADVLYPTAAWALTSGPSQPEFTSFEPVVTTTMVNEFSGDFTYNLPILEIPGPDGSGYALSLSYHSGSGPEAEASWVGRGWTLNPGALNRQLQGFPDDWSGEEVTSYNKAIPSKTVSVSGSFQPEMFSYSLPFNGDGTLRYNNYKGFGYMVGAGLVFGQGVVSLGFHVADGEGSFSLTVNPAALLTRSKEKLKDKERQIAEGFKTITCEDAQEQAADQKAYLQWAKEKSNSSRGKAGFASSAALTSLSSYGSRAMSAPTFPLSVNKMNGHSYTLTVGLVPTPLPAQVGISMDLAGRLAIQENEPSVTRKAYGYLHTPEGLTDRESALDYRVENATTYNKRDKFLPVPVNNADLFVATGEGIAGSMRFYTGVPGRFRPPYELSETVMSQIGGEINAGLNTGGSVDVGIGRQQLVQEAWGSSSMTLPTAEPYFLRMCNDKGGWVYYDGSDGPRNANVNVSGAWGFQSGSADDQGLSQQLVNGATPGGRSSFVGFHTNAEMVEEVNGVAFNNYEKQPFDKIVPGSSTYDRQYLADHYPDLIGEVAVLNPVGQRYVYGLPVLAAKDRNLSVAPSDNSSYDPGLTKNQWASENISYSGVIEAASAASGQSTEGAYASSFLLTSITGPDYIDRTNDGPSADDFGGYTKFAYEHLGSPTDNTLIDPSSWYQWRMPVSGGIVERGALSECHDDRLSFSAGARQTYYLSSITTKTHVAYFSTTPWNGVNGMKKLKSILLFSLEDLSRPLKTIHFEYVSHGWGESSPNYYSNMTLKRVWTEYNGAIQAKISPYEFEYDYPDVDYPVTGISPANIGTIDQAPPYSELIPGNGYIQGASSDPWGYYREKGTDRCAAMETWVDQSPDNTFDPAAHQLKVIRMPSGGEIHIQYEQDDYLYVQGDRAHAMARLAADQTGLANHEFRLSLSDLGTDLTDPDHAEEPDDIAEMNRDADEVAALIRSEYVGQNKRMFFKMLYTLNGTGTPDLSNGSRNKEYIEGYAVITAAVAEPGGTVKLALADPDGHSLPREICQDLYNAEKRGKSLDEGCSCGNEVTDEVVSNTGSSSIEDIIKNFRSFIFSFGGTQCVTYAPEHSFFRVPISRRKLGGGLRVRRLLMYDPQGVDEGYPAVYGQEYIYRKLDERGSVVSSGVATNEPNGSRQENILVRPLDRLHQSWLDRTIAGRDMKQAEGPLGASVYPTASVGYSQVIARNIHTGKTAPTFSVKNFYTAKDYPVQVEATDMDDRTDAPIRVTTGVVNLIKDHAMASQGYAIKLNEMHGQPRRDATYHGDPQALLGNDEVFAVLSSATETEYFQPGENVSVIHDRYGHVDPDVPLGKESDVTIESRTVRDETDDATVEADFGMSTVVAPIPSFSMMGSSTTVRTRVDQHTITKVISYPAITKRTTVFKDGIYHVTQNIAFDPHTGEPAIVRTHDGFFQGDLSTTADMDAPTDGTYTTYTVPASMVYPGMGQAAKGEGKMTLSGCGDPVMPICITYEAGQDDQGELVLSANSPEASICDVINMLCVGDLIEVRTKDNAPTCPEGSYLYNLYEMEGTALRVVKTSYSDPIPSSCPIRSIRIVRSGCGNQLDQKAGTYTLYGPGTLDSETDPELGIRLGLVHALNTYIASVEDFVNNGASSPGAQLNDFEGHLHFLSDPGECEPDFRFRLGHPVLSDEYELLLNDVLCDGLGICANDLIIPHQYFVDGGIDKWGRFVLDPIDHTLMIYPPGMDCCPIRVECPQFDPLYINYGAANTVNCNATTYSDVWPYSAADYPGTPSGNNGYEKGMRGQWRPDKTYAYLSPTYSGPQNCNFNTGWFLMDVFNWDDPSMVDANKWIATNDVEAYSPDGRAIQEVDASNVHSCAKYGYDRQLPYLVAHNATLDLTHAEGFEHTYVDGDDTYLEDRLPLWASSDRLDNTFAHSGRWSFFNDSHTGYLFTSKAIPTPVPSGMLLKAWIRSVQYFGENAASRTPDVSTVLTVSGVDNTIPLRFVARSGEWSLYESWITLPSGTGSAVVSIRSTDGSDTRTWVDDIRLQPSDAHMNTYVYDPLTLRLLASFDDQNFGLFYQYNMEGKLVRKLIETERGMRTVQETQYHTSATTAHP